MYTNTQSVNPLLAEEYSPEYPEACPDDVSPHQQNIVVIIPAYNEERFIGSVVLRAREYARNVIVIDDGSVDDTARLALAAGAKLRQHKVNQGKGAALNTGFDMARQYDPDVTVILDADGQHLPGEIEAVTAPVLEGKADLVIGSRYLLPTSDVPLHRILGHRLFNHLTRLASGEAASDSQSGFRAFSQTAIQVVEFKSNGFSVESEMQFLVHEYGLKLVEVPITIRYPDKPKRSVFSQGMAVLAGILRLMGQYRPLFFFGLPGLVLISGGIGCGLWVVERFQSAGELAIGTALLSILLFIAGLIIISTGFTLYSIRGLLIDLIKKHLT